MLFHIKVVQFKSVSHLQWLAIISRELISCPGGFINCPGIPVCDFYLK